MRGQEAIVRLLEQAGVEVVFGLCGDTSLPYYEAFYDLKPNITHVLTRDERSAGYMADAYARLSGRVGVCEGPSGGGATYIIPGVAEANQSSVPLVCLTSDIDSRHRGRGTLTEIDQDALFEPITVWTKTPASGMELPRAFRQAFQRSTTGSLGASHIGLPFNVQEAQIPDAVIPAILPAVWRPRSRTLKVRPGPWLTAGRRSSSPVPVSSDPKRGMSCIA